MPLEVYTFLIKLFSQNVYNSHHLLFLPECSFVSKSEIVGPTTFDTHNFNN